MKNPTRRYLLCRVAPAVAVLPVGLALAGCTVFDAAIAKVPQFAADASTIANALSAVLPTIETLAGISQSVIARVTQLVGDIQATASQLAGATAPSAVVLVGALGSGVSQIINTLGGVALPPWISTVFMAATTLLPIIEQAVGIIKPPAAAPAPRFAAPVAPTMTAEQARSVLAMAAAR